MPDGRLIGKMIVVPDPTPTPTMTVTPTPTDPIATAGADTDPDAGGDADRHRGADVHPDAGAEPTSLRSRRPPRPQPRRPPRRSRQRQLRLKQRLRPALAVQLRYAKVASDILARCLSERSKMDEDTRHRSKISPIAPPSACSGTVWRVSIWLFALLAVAFAAGAYPWPVQSKQQDPGRATTSRAEGVLQTNGQGTWKVGRLNVVVDDTTVIAQKRGKAEPGSWVIVWGQQDRSGEMRAKYIQVDHAASLAAPTIQLSGMLRKQTSTWWMVEQTLIEITPDTVISGQPQIGVLVRVVATQQGEILRALAAEVLASDPKIAARRIRRGDHVPCG